MAFEYKRIGIIAALDEELADIVAKLNNVVVEDALHTQFHVGCIKEQQVVAVKCGVGKVNAAAATQHLVEKFDCDCVINVGVAGSTSDEVRKNHVVLSTDLHEHDMDCLEGPGVISRMNTSVFSSDKTLLELAESKAKDLFPEGFVHVGPIVSGDQFVSSKEKTQWLNETFGSLCTEMEGAAIAHVCYLNSVPFLVIRSISDMADEDALDSFVSSKDKAIDYTSSLLLAMLA